MSWRQNNLLLTFAGSMYNFRNFMKFAAVLGLVLLSLAGLLNAQSRRMTTYSESAPTLEKRSDKNQSEPPPETNQTNSEEEVIRVETDLIMVPTRITDRSGKSVGNLKKPEFKIFENGVEQEVAYFAVENQPFTVALVLDMSYSSVFKLSEIQYAAYEFINQLKPDDKVMVVSFDEKPHLLCEATNNRMALKLAIDSTSISSGTALYKTLDLVLNEKLSRIPGRKAIVLLSDGVDTSSGKLSAEEVLKSTTETDVLVYPIQYDTYEDVQKTRKDAAEVRYDKNDRPYLVQRAKIKGERLEDYKAANEFLSRLSEQTGGSLYKVADTVNLNSAFANIAEDLRKIYTLGYYPSVEREVGVRYAIKVRVYRPNLVIRARSGYIFNQNRSLIK
jgi:Ca-activated chloride channel homolog